MENKQVFVFDVGEPSLMNVIDIDYEKRLIQLQSPGHFGSYWTSFDKCLFEYQIDYHFICKASFELNRLEIKKTIMDWKASAEKV